MDDATKRLIDAARAVWEFGWQHRSAEIGDAPLQELYNAMRAMTGESCDHDWFPKAAYVGGKMFTYCGKCRLERLPDDPGIKVRER